MSHQKALGVVLIGWLATNASAGLVVPSAQASVAGNTANSIPFDFDAPRGIRYQQVYGASEFAAPIQIGELRFRVSEKFGNSFGPTTIGNIQLSLSTTASAPDGLSTTFEDNIGVDQTQVFGGTLELPGAGQNGLPFHVSIPLTTPFAYDPATGNLLLEIRKFSNEVSGGIFFEAHRRSGDSISRLQALDADAETATTNPSSGTVGLVTEFVAVPEPSLIHFLCLISVGGIVCHAVRRFALPALFNPPNRNTAP